MTNTLISHKIDIDQVLTKIVYLNEHRTELQDDYINWMGLSDPEEINYLNFADEIKDWGDPTLPGIPFSLEIFLS